MDKWTGKVALVTGASSGIGAAISKTLVRYGLKVVGLARRAELIQNQNLRLIDQPGRLYDLKTDITNEQEVLKAFNWIETNVGPVYILVNSAGLSKEDYLTEGCLEDWKKIFDVNVLGLCLVTKETVKMMRRNNIQGHIIHINSILGHSINNVSKVNVYPASKFAVTALTETLRQELNQLETGIKVTSISPGLVATEMTIFNDKISDERRKIFEDRPKLKCEDVADAVVYVLSTPEHVQIHELTIKPVGEPC